MNTIKIIIDRFEGDLAVVELEDGSFADLPRILVPSGAKEGSVLCVSLDQNETENRTEKIRGMLDKLFDENTLKN